MIDGINIDRLKELFYRCQFHELQNAITQLEQYASDDHLDLLLIKANALYELHRVVEATSILESIQKRNGAAKNFPYLYAAARLAYLKNDIDYARLMFVQALEKSESPEQKFKSLLGIANSLYSQQDFSKMASLIAEMKNLEPLNNPDDRISFDIFQGNYHLAGAGNPEKARQFFHLALSTSAKYGWTFFISRAFYGLACAAEKEQNSQEMNTILQILKDFVNETESIYFSYLVNERFKEHDVAIRTPIDFDSENKRVMIKEKWHALHDKPLLYRFLEFLHEGKDFASKDLIARELWPNEPYLPRVHDPRIFDIAKRARQLIEIYEDQPAVLLSGRSGYKLATI